VLDEPSFGLAPLIVRDSQDLGKINREDKVTIWCGAERAAGAELATGPT